MNEQSEKMIRWLESATQVTEFELSFATNSFRAASEPSNWLELAFCADSASSQHQSSGCWRTRRAEFPLPLGQEAVVSNF